MWDQYREGIRAESEAEGSRERKTKDREFLVSN